MKHRRGNIDRTSTKYSQIKYKGLGLELVVRIRVRVRFSWI